MYYTKTVETIDKNSLYNTTQMVNEVNWINVMTMVVAMLILSMLTYLFFYWYILRTGKLEDPVRFIRLDKNNAYLKFRDYMKNITPSHMIGIYVVSILLVTIVVQGLTGEIILAVYDVFINIWESLF